MATAHAHPITVEVVRNAVVAYADEMARGSLLDSANNAMVNARELALAAAESGSPSLEAQAVARFEVAGTLYAELDRTPFWRPHAALDSRSVMNVTWRLPSEELEEKFVKEAKFSNAIYERILRRLALRLKQRLVVQPQLELRHACKVWAGVRGAGGHGAIIRGWIMIFR